MAPAKRKQGKQAKGPPAKQPKQDGQKAISKDINVPVDEGFEGDLDTVRVYLDKDSTIFDASLNQTNIGGNNNKFYRLQLLESLGKKKKKAYFTHTRWGRVGEYGQVMTIGPDTFEEAMKMFEKKFKDKSGLTWDKRNDQPKSNKYTFIEKSYESDDEDDNAEIKVKAEDDDGDNDNDNMVESKLPMPTQRLMELIFNSNHFNSVLEDIGYNANKLPLGKLGKSTLKTGFEHLRELASLIKHPSLAQNKYGVSQAAAIEDYSNKYYSTIPHSFGRSKPPPINNDDILRREVAMLDTLSDMEVAASIMKGNASKKTKEQTKAVSVLDTRFNTLNLSECTPLEHKSSEYKELSSYLLDSSGTTHNLRYRLQDIFRIGRPDETPRFNTWLKETKLKDSKRFLLWHGSRTTNYGGILSQGLRIAPPEAPANGYAFGKGVYLADCSSKSANYCATGMSGGTGLLLLCEAELSNPMYEIPNGRHDAKEEAEKKGCIATKGVGKVVPLKWKDAGCISDELEGVSMPDGKPGPNNDPNTGFLYYNEYIVYNVAQIRLRYLFRVAM